MAYTTNLTFAQARTQLAQRLGDYSKVFWSDAAVGTYSELGRYIVEALRCWNALAQFSRDTASFSTTASTAFYDLFENPQLSATLGSKLMYTLRDQDLVQELQYHLLEPPNNWGSSTAWAGTEMFIMDDLVSALTRRRNQFLLETGMILTRSTVTGPTANSTGIVSLNDRIIDIRRVQWNDGTTGISRAMENGTDEWTGTHFAPGWNAIPGDPLTWSEFQNPHVSLQLIPPNLNAGTLDMLTVFCPPDLDVTANAGAGTLLAVPDDFAWVVKFGALADLTGRDGPARCPDLNQYAEQRWAEGILAARAAASVNLIQLGGKFVDVQSLFDADGFDPTWVNRAAGAPVYAGMASWNMLFISPVPDATYTIGLDIVRSQPVPVNDADIIQVGREQTDVILDYAEHLAMIKAQGAEFAATAGAYKNLLTAAMEHNARLAAQAKGFESMQTLERKEMIQRPMRDGEAAA